MKTEARRVLVLGCLLAVAACGEHGFGSTEQAVVVSTDLVISQVYGGGGNANAVYMNDFVEIVNIGTTSVQMSNYSVQYASSSGQFSSSTATLYVDLPSFSLAPGQYFLVQLASGGNNGTALPTADATGTISMSATNGKVALTMKANKLNACGDTATPCAATDWVDLVGYGSAQQYEGTAAAPAMSNTTSDTRKACTDTGDNAADFTNGTPVAHNSASTFLSCSKDAGTDASDGGIVVVDGGAADSGTDSGAIDSGTDSGTIDGGAVDSGATDSGATDSGASDSGASDSGASDSGFSFDSGIKVDSGASDSGAKDSGTDAGFAGYPDNGGCSCEVRGSRSTPAWAGIAWAVGLAALVESRRRKRR